MPSRHFFRHGYVTIHASAVSPNFRWRVAAHPRWQVGYIGWRGVFCRGWRGSFKIVKENMVIDQKGAVLAKREGKMAKKHHNFPSHGWTHIQQQWLYDHQHPNLKNENEYGPNQRGVDPVVWQKRPCRGSITKKTWNLLTVGHSNSTWISSPSYWVPLIWFFKMNWHALC